MNIWTVKIQACSFVFLEVFYPIKNYSLILIRHHNRWRATYFDLYSALIAIEQWWFFSLPHRLWQRLESPRTRGPHTCCRAYNSGAVTTWFGLYRLGFEQPTLRMRGKRLNKVQEGNLWRNICMHVQLKNIIWMLYNYLQMYHIVFVYLKKNAVIFALCVKHFLYQLGLFIHYTCNIDLYLYNVCKFTNWIDFIFYFNRNSLKVKWHRLFYLCNINPGF